MQSSNIPAKIPLPFAYAAGPSYKNTIPTASQIGITNGRASLTDGFPPLTFTALSAGGVPPFGADFNGILNEVTAIQQWQNAGGMFYYDSVFSTAVGGYPAGAVLQSTSKNGLWISNTENNTTDPDAGGAGWISFAWEGAQPITVTTTNVTLTQLQSAYPVIVVSGAKTAARSLIFPNIVGEWIVQNNTTGAFTLTAKTAAGTGVTLTQGESTFIYGDGTNIYFADSAKVASFNGRVGTVTLNATDVTNALGYTPANVTTVGNKKGSIALYSSTTLTAAQAGNLIEISGTSGYTTTLPGAAGIGGSSFTIFNLSSAVQTVNGGGSVIWWSGNATSTITLQPGIGIEIISDNGNWSAITPQFPASLGINNGWIKFPNGMIMQWAYGPYVDTGDTVVQVDFPITFPNVCVSMFVSTIGLTSNLSDAYFQEFAGPYTSYCLVVAQYQAGGTVSGGVRPRVLAIGY